MSDAPALAGRTIALCLTGGIAAYKSVFLARLLLQAGATVQPVMTASASRFVGKVTLSGLCARPVLDDMWDSKFGGEAHVSLADEADVVVIAPTTADMIARLAQGRADDLVAALALVARGPVVIAPAMHPRMWAHPATQRNVATLRADGRLRVVGPVVGPVANGDVGLGRMCEPEEIFAAVLQAIEAIAALAPPRDLAGRHVVVTAGPTVEDLDPVRFLGNRSTGKMGFAVAAAAAARGARVSLVAGPVALPTPPGVERIDVRSALEMQRTLDAVLGPALEHADALVMAAAVADYRPATFQSDKAKKPREGQAGDAITIELVRNPDVLAEIGARRARGQRARPVLVGFAVETRDLVDYARKKLHDKRVDFVVGNLAAHGFGGDDDEVVIVGEQTAEPLRASKRAIADAILDRIAHRLSSLPA
jgi:phosphopantothenoylcysteine decarboxylase/phosphopantothenate--cysteine ligase